MQAFIPNLIPALPMRIDEDMKDRARVTSGQWKGLEVVAGKNIFQTSYSGGAGIINSPNSNAKIDKGEINS